MYIVAPAKSAAAVVSIFVVPLFCVFFHFYIFLLCLCIFAGPVSGTCAGEPGC
jgi:hypothetical protein